MDAIDPVLVAVRAVHIGATLVLFGEIFFAWLCADMIERHAARVPGRATSPTLARFRRTAALAWLSMVISGACWLASVSVQMSGRPLDEAVTGSALKTVLGSTVFGHAWSVRMLLAFALAVLTPTLFVDGVRRRGLAAGAALVLSGVLLASLAWAGHANAQIGADGMVHHASDAIHLLAAGAWIGALAPLAATLRRLGDTPTRGALDAGAAITTRFGNWAALCVGVLLLTGLTNSYFLVASPRALFATAYGTVLLAKLLAFALMLAVAATNRTRLTTALRAANAVSARLATARRLRRNVLIEQALAAGVVILVAVLGVTPPATM